MRLDPDGNWRGQPRDAVDGSPLPAEICVAVYTAGHARPANAQVNLRTGAWGGAIYSTPDQLREFAALLVEAAGVIDMLAMLDHDDADDGPHITPDSAERLEDCVLLNESGDRA